MNIQQAASISGLTPDTIRFYERKRILPLPPRGSNGYRRYTDEHVSTLKLAKGLRELELPLADVAPILAVAHDGTCGEIRESMRETFGVAIEEIAARIDELEGVRRHLRVLLRGLEKMEPKAQDIPGIDPCECVQMVVSD